jgi:hypothetical protein
MMNNAIRQATPHRVWIVAGVTSIALIGAVGYASLSANASSSAPVPLNASQVAVASRLAHQYALLGTGASPDAVTDAWPASVTCAVVAPANHGAASSAMDNSVPEDPNASVMVIQLCGSFKLDTPRPPGAAIATGSYIVVVANATSGELLDVSIGHNASSLVKSSSSAVDLMKSISPS